MAISVLMEAARRRWPNSFLKCVPMFVVAFILVCTSFPLCRAVNVVSVAPFCSSLLPYSKALLNPAADCSAFGSSAAFDHDAQQFFKTMPQFTAAINSVSASTSNTCARDLASLMCQIVYLPITGQLPCSAYCNATVPYAGNPITATSCSAIQIGVAQSFLTLPAFNNLFTCTSNAYSSQTSQCNIASTPQNFTVTNIPTALCLPASQAFAADVHNPCLAYIQYPVYVDTSQIGTAAALSAQMSALFKGPFLIFDKTNHCVEDAAMLTCSFTYPKCDTFQIPLSASLNVSIPLPSFAAQSACTRTASECFAGIAVTEQAAPQTAAIFNCNTTNLLPAFTSCGTKFQTPNTPAQLDKPLAQTVFGQVQVGTTNITLMTAAYDAYTTLVTQNGGMYPVQDQFQFVCPVPLVVPDNPQAATVLNGQCAVQCQSPLFSNAEWIQSNEFMAGLGWVSFLATLFFAITWTIFPVKRKQHFFVVFNWTTFALSVTFLFGSYSQNGGARLVGCKTNTQPDLQSDGGWCLYQSIGVQFLVMAAVEWWLVISVDLWMKVALFKKFTRQQKRQQLIGYHIFVWSIPLLMVIINLSSGTYGRYTVVPFCFIADSAPTGFEWFTFYIPLLIFAVTGALTMSHTIFAMMRTEKSVSHATKRRPGWWKQNIRPIAFIFQYLFIFSFLVAFRSYVYFHQGGYQSEIANVWIPCLLTNAAGDYAGVCGSVPPNRLNPSLWWLVQFCAAGQGVVLSVLNATQTNSYYLWLGLITGKGVNWDPSSGESTASKPKGSERSNKEKERVELSSHADPDRDRDDYRGFREKANTTTAITSTATTTGATATSFVSSTPMLPSDSLAMTARSSMPNMPMHMSILQHQQQQKQQQQQGYAGSKQAPQRAVGSAMAVLGNNGPSADKDKETERKSGQNGRLGSSATTLEPSPSPSPSTLTTSPIMEEEMRRKSSTSRDEALVFANGGERHANRSERPSQPSVTNPVAIATANTLANAPTPPPKPFHLHSHANGNGATPPSITASSASSSPRGPTPAPPIPSRSPQRSQSPPRSPTRSPQRTPLSSGSTPPMPTPPPAAAPHGHSAFAVPPSQSTTTMAVHSNGQPAIGATAVAAPPVPSGRGSPPSAPSASTSASPRHSNGNANRNNSSSTSSASPPLLSAGATVQFPTSISAVAAMAQEAVAVARKPAPPPPLPGQTGRMSRLTTTTRDSTPPPPPLPPGLPPAPTPIHSAMNNANVRTSPSASVVLPPSAASTPGASSFSSADSDYRENRTSSRPPAHSQAYTHAHSPHSP